MNSERKGREAKESATASEVLQVISDALNDDHGTTLLIVCRAGKGTGANVVHALPEQEECKAHILRVLHSAGGTMPVNILDATVRAAGYSFSAIKRAKRALKQESAVECFSTGREKAGDKVWHIEALKEPPDAREKEKTAQGESSTRAAKRRNAD